MTSNNALHAAARRYMIDRHSELKAMSEEIRRWGVQSDELLLHPRMALLKAMLAAVVNSRLEMVRLLIERGADVNNGGKDGRLPLTIARSRARRTGRTEIVDLLLSAGAEGDQA